MAQAAAVSWQTHYGETVTIGDLVALCGLSNRDAKGRIIAAADKGRVECVLGDDPHAKSPRLTVDAENLLALLVRGGGETIDKKLFGLRDTRDA